MPKITQTGRPMAVQTPLGPDVLLLERFRGAEEISGLFHFYLEMLAESPDAVPFQKLLGQPITVSLTLPGGGSRYFHGIVSRLTQGPLFQSSKGGELVRYRAEMVPRLWLLTRRAQCRVFQQLSVPDVLKQVLTGLDVSFQLQGTYPKRDYCVQYRETDFAFASRLMEDEGIWYAFQHSAAADQLVVSDAPSSHPDVPGASKAVYDESSARSRPENQVFIWETTQEVRSGKYTLRDYCFALPDQDLEAQQVIQESATVGTVGHPFRVADNGKLEIYDYPGGYAHRFDDVAPGGGDQSADLQKIFDDNRRTVGIRMQEEAAAGLVVTGESYCRQFTAGCRFTLERHFNAAGPYVLTRVEHAASQEGTYTSGSDVELEYRNRFQCIPPELPFRPARRTHKPIIAGAQTAFVVENAPNEQIFCDKYGRVKVQFHWDRQGKNNAQSSCWLRVAQPWAGGNYGAVTIPRVGHEVVVAFLEGDPDRPLVVGNVYNSKQMPPFPLPANKTQSGFKTSSKSGKAENFSGLGFEDDLGQEHVHLHSERHMTQSAEQVLFQNIGAEHHVNIGGVATRQVGALPGLGHTMTSGSPGPVGSGPGQVIGRLGALGGAYGSGSGDGGAYGQASGPYQQSGPFLWNPNVAGTWAADLDLVIGWRRCNTLGLYTQTNLGAMWNTTISFGSVPLLGKLLGKIGLGNIDGVVNAIIGPNTTLHYGPLLTVDRGAKIDAAETPTGWAKAFAALYCIAAVWDVFLPLVTGQKSKFDHPEGWVAGWAVGSVALTTGLLAAWAKLETVEKKVQIVANLGRGVEPLPTLALHNDQLVAPLLGNSENIGSDLVVDIGVKGPGPSTSMAYHMCDAPYSIAAPTISILSTLDDPADGPSAIFIQAMGCDGEGGDVLVYANSSVLVVGGVMASINVETNDAEQGQITLDCGPDGSITLQSGIAQEPNSIVMGLEGIAVSSLELIKLTAVESSAIIDPEEGITLQVAESLITITPEGIVLSCGPSSIEITPEGVVINGPTVTIAGDGETTISTAALMITE